jgi:hypothetical protein
VASRCCASAAKQESFRTGTAPNDTAAAFVAHVSTELSSGSELADRQIIG